MVHGTTLALNAIIQRRGARMGLVVSARQSRRAGDRPRAASQRVQLPGAKRSRRSFRAIWCCEVSARLDVHGAVVAEATEAEFDAIAQTFRAAGVDAVTVMLLHSYANPEFELDLATRCSAN